MGILKVIAAVTGVAAVALMAYLVKETAAGQEDWLELAAIVAATLVVGAGLFARRAPRRSGNPVLRRTPESDW